MDVSKCVLIRHPILAASQETVKEQMHFGLNVYGITHIARFLYFRCYRHVTFQFSVINALRLFPHVTLMQHVLI